MAPYHCRPVLVRVCPCASVFVRRFETVRMAGSLVGFTYRLEYRLPIPLVNSFLMKREWSRIIQASLQNLKQTLEA